MPKMPKSLDAQKSISLLLLIEKSFYENTDYDPDVHAALKELKRRARKEKD